MITQKMQDYLAGAPDRVVIKEMNGRSYTLQELSADVSLLAGALEANVGSCGRKVFGIAMRSCYEWVSTLLAIQKVGGVLLPVPIEFSDDQIESLLGKATAVFVSDDKTACRLRQILPAKPCGVAPGFACVGITYGDSGKLFSEYYLEEPLDRTYAVDRARIVEIGAFASFQSGSGAGRYLLNTVIKTLSLHNYGLVVLTATEQVRQILGQIVTCLDDLGNAELSRVKDPQVNWGTYYNHAPRVVASRLTPPTSWVHKPCSLVRPRTFALPASA